MIQTTKVVRLGFCSWSFHNKQQILLFRILSHPNCRRTFQLFVLFLFFSFCEQCPSEIHFCLFPRALSQFCNHIVPHCRTPTGHHILHCNVTMLARVCWRTFCHRKVGKVCVVCSYIVRDSSNVRLCHLIFLSACHTQTKLFVLFLSVSCISPFEIHFYRFRSLQKSDLSVVTSCFLFKRHKFSFHIHSLPCRTVGKWSWRFDQKLQATSLSSSLYNAGKGVTSEMGRGWGNSWPVTSDGEGVEGGGG